MGRGLRTVDRNGIVFYIALLMVTAHRNIEIYLSRKKSNRKTLLITRFAAFIELLIFVSVIIFFLFYIIWNRFSSFSYFFFRASKNHVFVKKSADTQQEYLILCQFLNFSSIRSHYLPSKLEGLSKILQKILIVSYIWVHNQQLLWLLR